MTDILVSVAWVLTMVIIVIGGFVLIAWFVNGIVPEAPKEETTQEVVVYETSCGMIFSVKPYQAVWKVGDPFYCEDGGEDTVITKVVGEPVAQF